jgi:hypothetical protein
VECLIEIAGSGRVDRDQRYVGRVPFGEQGFGGVYLSHDRGTEAFWDLPFLTDQVQTRFDYCVRGGESELTEWHRPDGKAADGLGVSTYRYSCE